ncbi:MAG: tetratricopeptide repeat protein [Bacillota bacterium]
MNEYLEVKSLVAKAIKYKKEKEYEKALDILIEGIEEYPDNNYLKSSLADTYFRIKRFDQAEKLSEEVLNSDPENYNAMTVKANLAYAKKDYNKAVKLFKEAYALNKSDYLASRIIISYIYLEEYQLALSLCNQKLKEKADNKNFQKLQIQIYKKMEEFKKAASLLDNYLEENDDQFAFKDKIEMKLKNKKPVQAIKELENLLRVEKYKNNLQLQLLYADKLQEQSRFNEAVEVYQNALLLDANNNYTIKKLGFCLYKANRWEEALIYLKKSFEDQPNDYHTRTTLEFLFKKLDKEQEGMAFFEEIIKETGLKNLWGIYKKLDKEAKKKGKEKEVDENE